MSDFLWMGGYAAFVWSAYGVALLILGGMALLAWRRLRSAERALAALEPRRGKAGTARRGKREVEAMTVGQGEGGSGR